MLRVVAFSTSLLGGRCFDRRGRLLGCDPQGSGAGRALAARRVAPREDAGSGRGRMDARQPGRRRCDRRFPPPRPGRRDPRRCRLAGTSLVVSSSGTVVVRVTCPAAVTRCVGTLTLRTLAAVVAAAASSPHAQSRKVKAFVLALATASFTIAGGQASVVKLHLSARARALLARMHVTRARATILARDPTGATHTTQTTVTLRAAGSINRHGKR